MKKLLLILMAMVGVTMFTSCIKDLEYEGVYTTTHYRGIIIDRNAQQPVEGIRVICTDGEKNSEVVNTYQDGSFEIDVTTEERGKGFYLKVEADSLYEGCLVKLDSVALGLAIFDLGVIYVNGPEIARVSTSGYTDVRASSVRVFGAVIDNGNSTVTERGFCWSTQQYPTYNDSHCICGAGLGSYEGIVKNIMPAKLYYIRAYAVNGVGVGYGKQIQVETLDGLPKLKTNEVSALTATSGTCGGEVFEDGGFAVTVRGVCWSTSMQPTIHNARTTNGTGLGTFVSEMRGLEPGRQYYIRAYATNAAGTAYGEQKTFTTLSGHAVVTTSPVTNIKETTAHCGGVVSSDGGFMVTARGVCYSTTPNPTITSPHTNDGAGLGNYISQMNNLTPHTTYYVRAYARNSTGTVYGEEISFVTR